MHRPKHRKVLGRVREMCLALPDTAEKISRGHIPVITVKGKNFAMLWRADGRPNVCLSVPPGAQGVLVEADPDRYFVPAYVGVRGWVGVRLDGEVLERGDMTFPHPGVLQVGKRKFLRVK